MAESCVKPEDWALEVERYSKNAQMYLALMQAGISTAQPKAKAAIETALDFASTAVDLGYRAGWSHRDVQYMKRAADELGEIRDAL